MYYKIIFDGGIQDLILPKNSTIKELFDLIGKESIVEIQEASMSKEEYEKIPEWNP